MRKQNKHIDSLANDIEYKHNGNNTSLKDILFNEQKGYCAYTETFLGRTDQKDIDHFNPSKDFIDRDKYTNLFLCKSQWNKEKSKKWTKYQPVLSPLADDFKSRINYNKDLKLFEATNEDDEEAKNLVKLLKLDDYDLSVERRKHIDTINDLLQNFDKSTFFKSFVSQLQFITSLEYEFSINIWDMLYTHSQNKYNKFL